MIVDAKTKRCDVPGCSATGHLDDGSWWHVVLPGDHVTIPRKRPKDVCPNHGLSSAASSLDRALALFGVTR